MRLGNLNGIRKILTGVKGIDRDKLNKFPSSLLSL
jgi:hypothetical protein